MAQITNQELVLIKKVYKNICKNSNEILNNNKEWNITLENIKKLGDFIKTVQKEKQCKAEKQMDFNKTHIEHHRITNKISYYLKKGNQEKVDFWREELRKYNEKRKNEEGKK